MAENVSFPSRTGATVNGAIALPAGNEPAPAVVLLHEYWGLNAHIRSLADRLATAGFVVLAPDLFQGAVATNASNAQRLMSEMKWSTALEDVAGAVTHLMLHARSTGKVGVTGFCMGGAGALAAACNLSGLSAAVAFYGMPPAQYADWDKAKVPPIQAHFALRDEWARPDVASVIAEKLKARGKTLELHVYDADHAFMNDTRPEVYDAESATLAWSRMVEFFHKHLG